jgi:hypothetical protein
LGVGKPGVDAKLKAGGGGGGGGTSTSTSVSSPVAEEAKTDAILFFDSILLRELLSTRSEQVARSEQDAQPLDPAELGEPLENLSRALSGALKSATTGRDDRRASNAARAQVRRGGGPVEVGTKTRKRRGGPADGSEDDDDDDEPNDDDGEVPQPTSRACLDWHPSSPVFYGQAVAVALGSYLRKFASTATDPALKKAALALVRDMFGGGDDDTKPLTQSTLERHLAHVLFLGGPSPAAAKTAVDKVVGYDSPLRPGEGTFLGPTTRLDGVTLFVTVHKVRRTEVRVPVSCAWRVQRKYTADVAAVAAKWVRGDAHGSVELRSAPAPSGMRRGLHVSSSPFVSPGSDFRAWGAGVAYNDKAAAACAEMGGAEFDLTKCIVLGMDPGQTNLETVVILDYQAHAGRYWGSKPDHFTMLHALSMTEFQRLRGVFGRRHRERVRMQAAGVTQAVRLAARSRLGGAHLRSMASLDRVKRGRVHVAAQGIASRYFTSREYLDAKFNDRKVEARGEAEAAGEIIRKAREASYRQRRAAGEEITLAEVKALPVLVFHGDGQWGGAFRVNLVLRELAEIPNVHLVLKRESYTSKRCAHCQHPCGEVVHPLTNYVVTSGARTWRPRVSGVSTCLMCGLNFSRDGAAAAFIAMDGINVLREGERLVGCLPPSDPRVVDKFVEDARRVAPGLLEAWVVEGDEGSTPKPPKKKEPPDGGEPASRARTPEFWTGERVRVLRWNLARDMELRRGGGDAPGNSGGSTRASTEEGDVGTGGPQHQAATTSTTHPKFPGCDGPGAQGLRDRGGCK